MWKVNVQGTFNMNRLATQAMFKHTPEVEGEHGVLNNVSSIAGYEGQSGHVAYSMNKGALHGMTLAWVGYFLFSVFVIQAKIGLLITSFNCCTYIMKPFLDTWRLRERHERKS